MNELHLEIGCIRESLDDLSRVFEDLDVTFLNTFDIVLKDLSIISEIDS